MGDETLRRIFVGFNHPFADRPQERLSLRSLEIENGNSEKQFSSDSKYLRSKEKGFQQHFGSDCGRGKGRTPGRFQFGDTTETRSHFLSSQSEEKTEKENLCTRSKGNFPPVTIRTLLQQV